METLSTYNDNRLSAVVVMSKVLMKPIKYCIFICVLSALLIGCTQLQSGFIKLYWTKDIQVQEAYGQGEYYRFVARGSEIRNTAPSNYEQHGNEFSISAMRLLVPKYMEASPVCENDYEIIEQSITRYEGGSTSIYVRCM